MTRYRVAVVERAEVQLRTIDAWWRTHRTVAPELFVEELAAAFERIADVPFSGSPYALAKPVGVRRTVLRRTRYHVYYTVDESARLVVVRAVWHMSRGHGPPLR